VKLWGRGEGEGRREGGEANKYACTNIG